MIATRGLFLVGMTSFSFAHLLTGNPHTNKDTRRRAPVAGLLALSHRGNAEAHLRKSEARIPVSGGVRSATGGSERSVVIGRCGRKRLPKKTSAVVRARVPLLVIGTTGTRATHMD